MSGIALYEHQRSRRVHGDPGGGITLCGRLCSDPRRWSLLSSFGSLYDVDCQLCRASLIAAGDLPRKALEGGGRG